MSFRLSVYRPGCILSDPDFQVKSFSCCNMYLNPYYYYILIGLACHYQPIFSTHIFQNMGRWVAFEVACYIYI